VSTEWRQSVNYFIWRCR